MMLFVVVVLVILFEMLGLYELPPLAFILLGEGLWLWVLFPNHRGGPR